jgi:hypothetical protein
MVRLRIRGLEDRGLNLKILFIDDNHYDYSAEIQHLRARGHDVTVAANFDAALRALQDPSATCEVVLIDVVIPPGHLPSELVPFVPEVAAHLQNTGQLLGLWLQKNRPDIQFAYMSIVEHEVDRRLHASCSSYRGVIDRNRDQSWGEAFADEVAALFRKD